MCGVGSGCPVPARAYGVEFGVAARSVGLEGTALWGALGAGAAGWLLLAAGGGKASDLAAWRRGLGEGGIVPPWALAVVAVLVPPLEVVVGAGALVAPGRWTLLPAGVLFALFAAYQAEEVQRGRPADCNCYGRLRRVEPGPPAILANALLAAAAVAVAEGGDAGTLPVRLLGGAALAAAYLLCVGRSRPASGWSGFPYAEVAYVRHRLAGTPEAEARAAVAQEFGLGVGATYLLVPRHRAWRLVAAARWRRWRLGDSEGE